MLKVKIFNILKIIIHILDNDEQRNLNLIEDNEIILNKNKNPSLFNIPGRNNVVNEINTNSNKEQINGFVSKINNQLNTVKDLEGKLATFKKNWEKIIQNNKEMLKKRDLLMNQYIKNGIRDFHYEYLESMLKAHNLKLFIIENRFKEKFNNIAGKVKEDYISLLEGQLKIRDNLIKKQILPVYNDQEDKIRPLEELKKEYTNKLPLILNHKLIKDSYANIDLNFSNISSNNLPSIKRFSSNPNDIKATNNIARLENNIYNNYNSNIMMNSGNNKNKLKNEYIPNLNKLEIQNNKLISARNYSQGVRNLNMGILNNNSYLNSSINTNKNQNEHNQALNNIKNLNHINSNNNIPNNPIFANQKQQINKNNNPSNYNISIPRKREKKLNMYLVNQKKKESNSEHSDSNILLNEYDSYLVDLDNSGETHIPQYRKIKDNIGERKSAQPKTIKIRNDITLTNSPLRKEYQKNLGSVLKKESVSIPQVKKKDLNVFLNEKNKSNNINNLKRMSKK